MTDSPDDIVGHKTFSTGEIDPETGFPGLRHEPLTRAEGEALWRAARDAQAKRAADMPDQQSAIDAMHNAWTRLKELGWRDPSYCPKDGSSFWIIEAGSTGIFKAHYSGEWPKGSWWAEDGGDLWPSSPTMFKLFPEDAAKEKARWEAAGKRWRLMQEAEDAALTTGK